MTPQQYMAEIVLPTVEDYVADTSSRRRAYLACIVTYHMEDYLKAAGVIDPHAAMMARCDGAWMVVKGVANGSKHRHGTKGKDQVVFLAGSDQYRPPAVAGELECGFSIIGDYEGSIVVPTDDEGLWADVLPCLRTIIRQFRLLYGGDYLETLSSEPTPGNNSFRINEVSATCWASAAIGPSPFRGISAALDQPSGR